MAKIILVQAIDNALGAEGLVPGFQTEYSFSQERDNSTETTKFGSISAIGALTETMSVSMFGKADDAGQNALQDAIEKGQEIKVWEVNTEKNKKGTYDARFAFAVIDSHEVSSPVEGLEEISAELTVQIQSAKGEFITLPEGLINFAKYGFQLPGETTGDHNNYTDQIDVTAITVTPDPVAITGTATKQLVTKVEPSNAPNQQVTYTSAKDSVATVSPTGLVTGVAPGTTTITVASVSNPAVTKTVTVNIS